MNVPKTQQNNDQLNAIKDEIRKSIKGLGYQVNGQFISNTPKSKDYLAFVNIIDPTMPNYPITHSKGLPLEELQNTDDCVNKIKEAISFGYVNIFN